MVEDQYFFIYDELLITDYEHSAVKCDIKTKKSKAKLYILFKLAIKRITARRSHDTNMLRHSSSNIREEFGQQGSSRFARRASIETL